MTFGRDARAGYWIPTWPTALVAALLGALLVMAVVWQLLVWYTWAPLQRYYLTAYVSSTVADGLGLGPRVYAPLRAIDRRGRSVIAQHEDVDHTETADGRTLITVSAAAERRGVVALRPIEAAYWPGRWRDYLESAVYGGSSLAWLAAPAVVVGLIALAGFLGLAIPIDRQRVIDRRQGRVLRGPQLRTVAAFNAGRRWSWRRPAAPIVIALHTGPALCLPRDSAPKHTLIMGGTGSGKSRFIRHQLIQLTARDETAVVNDPHGDLLEEFFDPGRGDVVLNPYDARMPYWLPGDEVQNDAEALAMAQALFVDEQRDLSFFTKAAREIFAFLLMQHQPRAEQLVEWMTYGELLDDLLKDTPLSAYIHNTAPPQRTAVMATLTGVARTLAALPRQDDGNGCWSVRGWARERRGWVFLTSTPQTRARVIPLHSMWLDMLILELMGPGRRKASFFLDEIASLHRIPQLQTAITESRKYDNPIVIGCQGRSQLDARYGQQDAETMIAQPATKVFLRTSEPRAAEWASLAIGTVEIERLAESRRDAWGVGDDNHQLSLQRSVEPLVLASQLQGLPDLYGYVTYGNDVVPIRLAYVALPKIHPAFVPRELAPSLVRPIAAAEPLPVAAPAIRSLT